MTSRFVRAGHARLRVLAAVAAVAACLVPATAQAAVTPLTIETQNLYLGADLTPAIAAQNAGQFFAAANQIWANVKASDPAARMGKIADEIATAKPDIVALQEVSKWTATNFGTSEPSFDFLTLLQSALSARGQSYTVASTSNNANIGPIPLPAGTPTPPFFLLTFQDRDVILVRNRPGLTFSNPQNANFAAQQTLTTPVGPLSFNRGWASIDGTVGGRSFHFVDTHLETESFPTVQVAEGNELLAGPLSGPGTQIAAGDFNSAADGSTTRTYANLTAVFKDAWINGNQASRGFTCCQAADLLNKLSTLSERIDLV
ncbi:MAG TPA: endonuclease/exonuclease/phosphatase family protein, partial [Solirubrobacteraceae bacterium]